MAEYNEIEDVVIPDSPNVIEGEQQHVYVPVASYNNRGIARFVADFFEVIDGVVRLSPTYNRSKADLIDGKVPMNQLPEGMGLEFDTKYFKVSDGVVTFLKELLDAKVDVKTYEDDNETIVENLRSKANLEEGVVPSNELPMANNLDKGIASFDSSAFIVIDGNVSISNDFLNRFKEVIAEDDINKLPPVGDAEKVYVVNGYLYYWNGSIYDKVKTVTSVEMPGLQAGEVDPSLVFFTGQAKGLHSIAGGSNDLSSVDKIRDALPDKSYYDTPTTNENLGLAYGIGSKSNAVASTAIGIDCESGARGYYWHSIDFASKIIFLSTKRPTSDAESAEWNVNDFNWAEGDYISIVNGDKYPFCAKITSVMGNAIMVDNLPFGDDYYSSFGYYYNYYYDRTVYSVSRYLDIVGRAVIQARKGLIGLGHGSTVHGINNIAAGDASFVGGAYNIAGDYAAVFGTNNVAGYGSFVTGGDNIDQGRYNFIAGRYNNIPANALEGTVILGMASDYESAKYLDGSQPRFILGGGYNDSMRGNAFVITENGNAYVNGNKLALKSEIPENTGGSSGGGLKLLWSGMSYSGGSVAFNEEYDPVGTHLLVELDIYCHTSVDTSESTDYLNATACVIIPESHEETVSSVILGVPKYPNSSGKTYITAAFTVGHGNLSLIHDSWNFPSGESPGMNYLAVTKIWSIGGKS